MEADLASEPDCFSDCSFWALATISFPQGFMKTAFRRTCVVGDVPSIPPAFGVAPTFDRLVSVWASDKKLDKKLASILLRTVKRNLLISLLLALLWSAMFVITPALLFPGFTRWLQDPTQSQFGWIYVALFLIANIVSNFSYSLAWLFAMICALEAKSSLTQVVINAALSETAVNSETGWFTNAIGNDGERVFTFFQHLPFGLASVLNLGGVFASLYVWMGPAPASIVVGLVALNFVFQRVFVVRNVAVRARIAPLTDERVQSTSETVSSIQLIKLYGWEPPRLAQLAAVRARECALLRISGQLQSLSSSVVTIIFWLAQFCGLVLYISLNGGSVSSSELFTIISVITIVRFPMQMLSNTIFFLGDASNSLERLGRLLLVLQKPVERVQQSAPSGGALLRLQGCGFSWRSELSEAAGSCLSNVEFEVFPGEIVCVVGATGSGKTTLLEGIVGGCEKKAGVLHVVDEVAFAQQSAWIKNASLRDNILFDRELDASWYAEVLRICQLEEDLRQLPFGDQTFIGERGVNLSGGQRQRVGIARALYSNRKLLMLDDPFSALDASVGRRLFEELTSFARREKRGLVLVLHQLQFCQECDRIVVLQKGLQKGRQVQQGSFALLSNSPGLFSELMRYVAGDADGASRDKVASKSAASERASEGALVQHAVAEDVVEGSIGVAVWMRYLRAMGLFWSIGSVVTSVCWTICRVMFDYFIVFFVAGTVFASQSQFFLSWMALSVGSVIFLILQGQMIVVGCLNGSQSVHDGAFSSVLYAKMSWFDVTPVGRITSRFSKDLDVVDKMLPFALDQFLSSLMTVLGSSVIAMIAMPYLGIGLLPICVVFLALAAFFRPASTQLRRLDGQARAPLFSLLAEAVSGGKLIRAVGVTRAWRLRLSQRADAWNATVFMFWSATRYLSLRLDLATTAVVFVVTVVAAASRLTLAPAQAALALSNAMRLGAILQWTIRQFIESEAFLASVERLEQFAKLPREGGECTQRAPEGWVWRGRVEFDGVEVRYDKSPVLRDVSFVLQPGEKLGVVGRTGAGKSSLVASLFRLVELSKGTIRIDGVDISRLRLRDLRAAVAIIPQDPILFKGTLLTNLDPFSEFSIQEVQAALDRVKLHSVKLNDLIEAGGANLSVGERQIVCIARALIRKAKVLVLDEASASLDAQSDQLVQAVMRSLFQNVTCVVVAHRLNTVIDADRVLVLDRGVVAELDRPSVLLKKQTNLAAGASFRNFVLDTGAQSARHLTLLAEKTVARFGSDDVWKDEDNMEADWSLVKLEL